MNVKKLENKEGLGQGTTVFSQRTPAWHAGNQIDAEIIQPEAAMKLSGLDWEVEKRELFLGGEKEVDGIPVRGKPIPHHRGIVRSSDEKILGVVGEGYEPIQNQEAFDFGVQIIENSKYHFSVAGEYYGGRNIYTVLDFDDGMDVKGDQISKHLLILSSHDGTSGFKTMFIPQRISCCNMLTGATSRATNKISIRHTKNYSDRMVQAKQMLIQSSEYYKTIETQFYEMTEVSFSNQEFKNLVKTIFPFHKNEKGNVIESSQIQKKRDQALKLWEHSSTMKNLEGTAWRAYNAIVEWVDYFKPGRATAHTSKNDLEMRNRVLGGMKEKNHALSILTD